MLQEKTTEELMIELGEQLRAQRLRINLTLDDVAKKTGLSINAVRRLESGQGSTLGSFVAVLKALKKASWLQTLQPPVTINPLDMLYQGERRQRAFKNRAGSKSPQSKE